DVHLFYGVAHLILRAGQGLSILIPLDRLLPGLDTIVRTAYKKCKQRLPTSCYP
ncbi:uncharacterized protein FOMMEDRAFT_23847, partial [Fomitiporia mediterranea MF3/22]|uniref:uncharacterized protein n=1 Tax=Fomitiporia mediterranea (strain MF3/22) TaxID=694068 RepID=UPI0004408118